MRPTRATLIRTRGMRAGFTLIELLVVIAIIAVLIALATAAAFQVMGGQRQTVTEKTIRKLSLGHQNHWRALTDEANKEKYPSETTRQALMTLAGNDPHRARVLWIKFRLKQTFPNDFAEALNPAGSSGIPAADLPSKYQTQLATAGTIATNLQPSVCLYLALKQTPRGSEFNIDSLGSHEVAETGVAGLKYFKDAWDNPIGFDRWGTVNPDIAGKWYDVSTDKVFKDMVDPSGLLSNPTWVGTYGATYKTLLGHDVQASKSRALEPIIRSFGRDGQSGTNDDIYSSRLK